MAVVRKKQDDKNLKILREIVSLSGNKQCFDCNQKGPTYVNMTIGSFVCTRCSGVLRGLTPPHRVKSISMATFSSDEIEFIKAHGNELCAKTWLGLWDPKRVHTQDQRELMIDKYERKRYYLEPASPLKSITNTAQLAAPSQKQQSQNINGQTTTAGTSTNATKSATETGASTALWSLSPPVSLNGNGTKNHNRNGLTLNGTKTNEHSLFTPDDDNSLFSSGNQTTAAPGGISLSNFNHNNNNNGVNISTSHNGNGLSNGNFSCNNLFNGFQQQITATTKQQNVITKNSLNIQQTVAASNLVKQNGFTPDGEFVADFSTANIFSATSINPPIAGISNATNNSGLSDRVTKTNHLNGNNKLANGIIRNVNGNNNTNGTVESVIANENFADFEHNTIYNAAAIENQNSNCFNSSVIAGSDNNNNFNNGSVNNGQWSVWQQFQWPFVQPEQNRWSLPMSLSSTSNSLKSSGTFNSNSSINSTPSIDRYAALKDLDEQLREIKEKETFNTQPSTASVVNPFNAIAPAQSQQIANPFQVAQSSPTMQNIWLNDQAMQTVPSSIQQQQQQQHHSSQPPFGITNGSSSVAISNMFSTSFGLNGSPYNGAQQQQQQAYQKMSAINGNFNGSMNTPNGFAQKNPFATPVLNATTNPFL